MKTTARSAAVVLGAAAIADLPLVPLADDPGVRHRVLWTDALSTAGVMVMDPGHGLDAHTHSRHHHHVWITDGQVRILGQDLGAGSYVHIPRGVEHAIEASGGSGCSFLYLYLDEGTPPDADGGAP